MSEYFQVAIPTTIAETHDFKKLIVETITDQNKDFQCLAEALLGSIEVVGISLDDLAKSPWCEHTHVNVTLQLRGPEVIMNAWAELNAMIF